MAKITINVPDSFHKEHRSLIGDVAKGLMSIIFPPPKPKYRFNPKWRRRVDTNQWVQVWEPEQY